MQASAHNSTQVSPMTAQQFMMNNTQSPFRTRIEWVSQLSVYQDPGVYRKTSIICTIGPTTNNVEMIQKLRKAGMNIARLNFSHGTYEYHGSVIKNIRDSFQGLDGRPVAIALDTKGPEIRTGRMKNDAEIKIPQGHVMILTTNDAYKDAGDDKIVYIDYKMLAKSTDPGKYIYIDDGQLRFEVLEINGDQVKVKALNSWTLSNNKGVNLPMTTVELPALSERDKRDLQFAVEQGLDMIFASFIRKASDIHDIRQVLGEGGAKMKVIAKIESHEGVDNFNEILDAADGIMVARGDLGIEIPAEKVFIAQKMIIARCNAVGKPVICATQMLETMTYNPRPTRAEVSDVANAVLDGADCVMLSGETAKGSYPIETVTMMHNLCREAEATVFNAPLFEELRAITAKPTTGPEAVASSAVNACMEHDAAAIIVLTTTGNSARLLAKYRPRVPIFTVTRFPIVARQSHLYRGTYPLLYEKPSAMSKLQELHDRDAHPGQIPLPNSGAALGRSPSSPYHSLEIWQEDVDQRFSWAMKEGIKYGMLKPGDRVIGVQGWKGGAGHTSVMRILTVDV